MLPLIQVDTASIVLVERDNDNAVYVSNGPTASTQLGVPVYLQEDLPDDASPGILFRTGQYADPDVIELWVNDV